MSTMLGSSGDGGASERIACACGIAVHGSSMNRTAQSCSLAAPLRSPAVQPSAALHAVAGDASWQARRAASLCSRHFCPWGLAGRAAGGRGGQLAPHKGVV